MGVDICSVLCHDLNDANKGNRITRKKGRKKMRRELTPSIQCERERITYGSKPDFLVFSLRFSDVLISSFWISNF